MIPVPVTLATAAAAVFVNTWLGMRIAQFRQQFKVGVGDGGHEPLMRRMRAQANFIEHTPLFLILLFGLELSGANRLALAILALIFILSRVAHGFGMDGGALQIWRRYGILATAFSEIALALWALFCALELCLGR